MHEVGGGTALPFLHTERTAVRVMQGCRNTALDEWPLHSCMTVSEGSDVESKSLENFAKSCPQLYNSLKTRAPWSSAARCSAGRWRALLTLGASTHGPGQKHPQKTTPTLTPAIGASGLPCEEPVQTHKIHKTSAETIPTTTRQSRSSRAVAEELR